MNEIPGINTGESLRNDGEKHIIMYSGGIGSWMTARRVLETTKKEDLILLFTDTLIEDEDLYRFIDETSADLGVPVTRLADGRTPWDVYRDKRFLGNTRVAPCSHVLKQDVARAWIKQRFVPENCIIYLGIDWTEKHRMAGAVKNWDPYRVDFPMCRSPFFTKEEMLGFLSEVGIRVPKLYELGFSHNNCGGFCCRAGQGHFAHLLEVLPERFLDAESKEEGVRQMLGRNVSILRSRKGGGVKPYTLRQLREDIEAKKEVDMLDIGGCGCFVDSDDDEDAS